MAARVFKLSEAVSFMVFCDTQEEIDYFWNKLSFVKESEQCGWLKDKFGLSWQIVPTILETLITDKDPQKVERVTAAFLKMKKFDISALKKRTKDSVYYFCISSLTRQRDYCRR